MKPEIKWISSLDLNIQVDDRSVLVPGNEIHGRLKQHENVVRSRAENIDIILNLEHEIEQLSSTLSEIRAAGHNELKGRVYKLVVEFLKELFLKKDDGRSPVIRTLHSFFLAELEIVANGHNGLWASLCSIILIGLIKKYSAFHRRIQ